MLHCPRLPPSQVMQRFPIQGFPEPVLYLLKDPKMVKDPDLRVLQFLAPFRYHLRHTFFWGGKRFEVQILSLALLTTIPESALALVPVEGVRGSGQCDEKPKMFPFALDPFGSLRRQTGYASKPNDPP